MTRRRIVAVASAVSLLAIGLLAALVFVSVTQTSFGRERVRRLLMGYASKAHGKVYIGRLGGGLLTGVTIDSLEIRDEQDSVFLATGKVTISYDPRDFLDRRVLLSYVQVERPFVHLKRHPDQTWNWRRIFPPGPKGPRRAERAFGDFVVIDSAVVHDGTVLLTMPWAPDDSLRGAARDSAVAFNLTRPDKDIRREGAGFMKTWRWSRTNGISSYVRLADSDSAGRFFAVERLDMREEDPPFDFRNIRGGVRHLGDSIWLDLSHWDAPGSTGRAAGKVVWGSDLPIRYDIEVVGDSVSLKDVAWVYPTLPTTGGGPMKLHIRNDPRNLSVIDYAIRDMDVRTTGSRLRGAMTFGVGAPVLLVRDVAMDAAPLDFALIRALNGKPFPYDWRGQITGRVAARGGPLTHFVVDSARFVFRDANVPGAVSSGTARGGLDILFPAFTEFHGFQVNAERLDLRTIQFLNPNFPRLGGYVAGRATLDSSWLDVRFRDADLTHADGPGEPTRMTGRGRVTYGEQFMAYDVELDAAPLSLSTLARSYPALPLRGPLRGPLRVRGTIEDLDVATTLTGDAGQLGLNAHFDLFAPRFAMQGSGSFADLDLRRLLAAPPPATAPAADAAGHGEGDGHTASSAVATALREFPPSDLTGQFDAELVGDSLADLEGALALELRRSQLDSVRIYGGGLALHFAAGVLRADTIALETSVGSLRGSGGLGLAADRRDSLRLSFAVDSLGGLRRYLGIAPDSAPGAGAAADSLGGSFTLATTIAGSVDTLDVAGRLDGRGLRVGSSDAHATRGEFSFFDLRHEPRGSVRVELDTVSLGGVALRRAGLRVTLDSRTAGRVALSSESENGPTLLAAAAVERHGRDTLDVRVDTMTVMVAEDRWTLAAPATLRATGAGLTLEPLELRGLDGGRLSLAGSLPETAPISLAFRADSVPLADVALLAQSTVPYTGRLDLQWQATGTRTQPVMQWSASLAEARFGGLSLDRVAARGGYADRRVDASLDLFRRGRPVVIARGRLPVDLSLVPVERRLLDDAPLSGSVRTDSAELSVLEAFTAAVERASGRLEAQVDVGGTWRRPRFTGLFTIGDGALTLPNLGVRLSRVVADIALSGDSVAVRKLEAQTVGERTGRATLTGAVTFNELANPTLDLTLDARNFHVIDRPSVADIELSTERGDPLHLTGSVNGSTLTGGVAIAYADIRIPELAAQKNVVSLDDPEFYRVVDTSLYTNRTLLPNAPPDFVRNLSVRNVQIDMGADTWLRSSEANINLGGAVRVTTSRNERDREKVQFALDGTLSAQRGTYRLNLGVVQRTFAIEQGTLRFYGTDPDLNPALDIIAVHTVRRFDQQDAKRDVRIQVKIGGTLAQPTLEISSRDDARLQQSDLLSYLITGQPSFEVGTAGENLNTLASIALPSVGSYLESRFSGRGLFDYVQLQAVGLGPSGTQSGQQLGSLLGRTRLGLGWQIRDRTFVSVNFGLCQFGSADALSQFNPLDMANSAGGRIEYQLSPRLGVSAALSVEPSTNQLLCLAQQNVSTRSFVPTPRQLGFDLFKKWEF